MGPPRTQSTSPAGTFELPSGLGGAVGDTTLSDALATLRKRFWVLMVAALLGVGFGAYKAFTQPRIFDAWGTLQVHNGESNEYKVNAADYFGNDSQTRMNTEVAVLKSDTLMFTVAKGMDLANNLDFLGAKGPQPRVSLEDPTVRANVLATLEGNVKIALVPRTEMIRIGYSSLSPRLAADIVNEVIKDYKQRSYIAPVTATRQVAEWLSGTLDELKSDVERSQQQMMDLQRRMGVLGYDSKNNPLSTSLEGLLNAEGTAKIARINAESRLHMVEGMDAGTREGSIETTPGTMPVQLNQLRGQLAIAKANYAQLTAAGGPAGGLGPNNPTVKSLGGQIDQLTAEVAAEQDRLMVQARTAFDAARADETKIEQELEQRRTEAYQQGNDLVQYTLLQREYEQNRSLYDGLRARLRTAEVQAGLDAAEVDPIDMAIPPVYPTMEPPLTIIFLNTLFFLLGGVVIAFILDSLDTGLHDVVEIETVMGLPSLAVVPRSKRANAEQAANLSTAQRNIHVLSQPKAQFAEAIRSLRTSLLLASAGRPPRTILFTSATPSEGKTTTVSNLACVLAQRDARVVLIDADLRRPTIHHRFGLTGRIGLTSVLAGTATLAEAMQRLPEVPNLDVLPSGPVPPFPTEMLGSELMIALLKDLEEHYTHIVIDSPPILSVTDGVVLSRFVDAVVLVIRHGKANRNVIRRARDLLVRSGAPMAGLVLNAVDLNSPDYYGYYGYSSYAYGNVDGDSWEAQGTAAAGASKEGRGKR